MHRLHARLLECERRDPASNPFATKWNWVDAYLYLEHGERATGYALYATLRQAMMARRALLILDGLDEGGRATPHIQRHVEEVLAPQGHALLITARSAPPLWKRAPRSAAPTSPSASASASLPPAAPPQSPSASSSEQAMTLASFHQLEMDVLDEEQQRACVAMRLGAERSASFLPWLEAHAPREADGRGGEAEHKVTASPLVLSLAISVYDGYLFTKQPWPKGLGMPASLVDLYTVATDRLLQLVGGVVAAQEAEASLSSSSSPVATRDPNAQRPASSPAKSGEGSGGAPNLDATLSLFHSEVSTEEWRSLRLELVGGSKLVTPSGEVVMASDEASCALPRIEPTLWGGSDRRC